MQLLNDGHRSLKEMGIAEGLKKYPSARRVMKSIENKTCYVVADEDEIIGMFAVETNGDPHYQPVSYTHLDVYKRQRPLR